jgi:hypothetical protein
VIFSGFDIVAGLNHCSGSVGVVTIGSSAWASASDVWIAAAVCRGGGGGEEEKGRGDLDWLTCWPSPKYQHLR